MKLDRKTYISRIILIVLCFVIALVCYKHMNDSYDPLARYPYASDENRDIILQYMSEEDIDYIINQQIKPDQFMSFIELKDFKVRNTVYYSICKNTQTADDEYIVYFVNRYRSYFSKDTLKETLKHYSYVDLTTFYETESLIYENLELIPNPTKEYTILDTVHSVYKYYPADLEAIKGIYVKKDMIEDLKDMMNAYQKVMSSGLTFESGYLSYENSMNIYVSYYDRLQDNVLFFYNNAGMDEQQLGYTISVAGCHNWIEQCIESETYLNNEYATIRENLDDAENEKIEWLEENAYRYGFVIRYEEGKEAITGHTANPYILRYVGKENAKKMHSQKKAMEEMKF